MVHTKKKKNHFVLTLLCLSLVGSYIYIKIGQYINYRKESAGGLHIKERKKFKLTNEKEFKLKEDAIYRQQVFLANFRPIRNSAGINCTKIVNNDVVEIEKSKQIMTESLYLKPNLTVEFYLNITNDCYWFRDSRGYIEHPLSKIEFEFPLAFSILAYRDIEQVERLLRLIYRPHNYYCIHLDAKMETNERRAFEKIAGCLNNVVIPEKSIDVKWGDFSLLEAELVCMNSLWSYDKWKYYMNLAGQEFPLKTNREIITILKALNGANVVGGSPGKNKLFSHRWTTGIGPPPHNIEPYKGSMHILANRFFVDFSLHDQRAVEFTDWLKKTRIPDETLFSSLHHNPHLGITGSVFGNGTDYIWEPFFLRYIIWETGVSNCSGAFVRNVCVLGVDELPKAYNSVKLFANKFHLDFERIALDCLEELLYERTWKEYTEDIPFNVSYYSNLEKRARFVKKTKSHHI